MTRTNQHPPRNQASPVDASSVLAWMTADPDAVTVLDVRTPGEFETRHITGSFNLPLHLVGEHAAALAARLDRKVVLVCQSGVRADQARQRLAAVGMANLHVLTGGVDGYAQAGGTVTTGRSRWAMERQVRMVAGGLVLLGVLTSRLTPFTLILSGGIGAGLAVSALTDTCTMARLLGKLPYNRAGQPGDQALLDRLPAGPAS